MTIEEDFDNFMKQLGESISEEELKALTAACQDVIPNEAREKIKKQRDLFSYLQKIDQLSQGRWRLGCPALRVPPDIMNEGYGEEEEDIEGDGNEEKEEEE